MADAKASKAAAAENVEVVDMVTSDSEPDGEEEQQEPVAAAAPERAPVQKAGQASPPGGAAEAPPAVKAPAPAVIQTNSEVSEGWTVR